MVTKTERNFFRAMISTVMLFLILALVGPMLSGCTSFKNAFGGEVAGVSVSLGAISLGASVKIPLGPNGPPPMQGAPETAPPTPTGPS